MKNTMNFPAMSRAGGFGLFAIAALFVGAVALSPEVARAESASAGPVTGWFSEAQVERGQKLYEARCATCHAREIADGWGGWDGTVQELVDMIKAMGMPADNPGGLPPQNYIDIAAYIMHNGGGLEYGEEVLAGSDLVNQAKRPE